MIHIKNVKIVDGTGAPAYPGELLLDGDTLREVSAVSLGDLDAETIDGGRASCHPGVHRRPPPLRPGGAVRSGISAHWNWPRALPLR